MGLLKQCFNFLLKKCHSNCVEYSHREVHRNSSHFPKTLRCIFKNKTTVISQSRIKAMTPVAAHRVGTPRVGILNHFPFCSFRRREELQIRSPLWTKIFKQDAQLSSAPVVSIPGDVASPSGRGRMRAHVPQHSFMEPWTPTWDLGKRPWLRLQSWLLSWLFLLPGDQAFLNYNLK